MCVAAQLLQQRLVLIGETAFVNLDTCNLLGGLHLYWAPIVAYRGRMCGGGQEKVFEHGKYASSAMEEGCMYSHACVAKNVKGRMHSACCRMDGACCRKEGNKKCLHMRSRTVGVHPPLLHVAQQWWRGFGWFTLHLVFVHEAVHNMEQGYMN